MPRKLEDIDIEEISLVERGANRKPFAITKQRRKLMDDLLKSLKEFLGDKADEVRLKKAAESLGEDGAKRLSESLAVLGAYLVDLPEPIQKAVTDLVGVSVAERVAKDEDIPIEKVGARLSKATVEELKKIREALTKASASLGNVLHDDALAGGEGEDEDKGKKAKAEKTDYERLKAEEKGRVEKAAKDEADAKERELKELKDRIEVLEKSKGVRKSIDKDDPDPDAVRKEEEDQWPSVPLGFLIGGTVKNQEK